RAEVERERRLTRQLLGARDDRLAHAERYACARIRECRQGDRQAAEHRVGRHSPPAHELDEISNVRARQVVHVAPNGNALARPAIGDLLEGPHHAVMMISRRDVELRLDIGSIPRDWYADDAYATTFLNALSMLFPEGERFFVESVKPFKDQIASPTL